MKYIESIISGVIGFFICYLLGAFYSVSFDISTWEKECLGTVTLIGGFVSILFFAISINNEYSSKEFCRIREEKEKFKELASRAMRDSDILRNYERLIR